MPLQDLLNAIEADANEEAARLERDAAAEAEAVLAAAREEAARARGEVLRARTSAAENEANRRLSLARLEAGRLEREAREEAFVLLLAEARRLLAASREEPDHRDVLHALMAEALSALPDATTVRVNPQDASLAGDLAREIGAGLSVTPDPDVGGGVALESAGGRAVRNTFAERLAGAEPSLRPWYGDRLEKLVAPAVAR